MTFVDGIREAIVQVDPQGSMPLPDLRWCVRDILADPLVPGPLIDTLACQERRKVQETSNG